MANAVRCLSACLALAVPASAAGGGARTSAVCAKVTPAAIARVIGGNVGKPSSFTSKNLFDASSKVYIDATSCAYSGKNPAAPVISYEVLSRPLSVGTIIGDIRRALVTTPGAAALGKWTVRRYTGLRVPAVYAKAKGKYLTMEVIDAVQGNKLVGATVLEDYPVPKLARLARLAVSELLPDRAVHRDAVHRGAGDLPGR